MQITLIPMATNGLTVYQVLDDLGEQGHVWREIADSEASEPTKTGRLGSASRNACNLQRARVCGSWRRVLEANWADGVEVKDGLVIAIITDTRPDGPLGREHVPAGTRFVIPAHKMKWDRGNPTGHIVIFLDYNREVFCYVTGTGI